MTRASFLLALVPLLAAAPAGAEADLEPGEWEQVMTITAPGQPAPPPRTVRQCITRSDAAIFSDHERWAQEMVGANPKAGCKVESSKREGSAVSVVLTCQDGVRLLVRQDFRGTTGTIDAESQVGGVTQNKNHIVSKKVSDTCSPDTIELWKRQNPGKTFEP
ncbi:MAG: DUF3617 family protein [Deltaproteobacteria bacterium]|nr:DUF3617 family protein [Deltaproteobacteria bacterium]